MNKYRTELQLHSGSMKYNLLSCSLFFPGKTHGVIFFSIWLHDVSTYSIASCINWHLTGLFQCIPSLHQHSYCFQAPRRSHQNESEFSLISRLESFEGVQSCSFCTSPQIKSLHLIVSRNAPPLGKVAMWFFTASKKKYVFNHCKSST